MRNTELLVPAGSLDVLKTAVVYGADAVYIGDSAGDVEAAKANGLYVIGVLYGDGDPEQVRRAGPDAVAPTPEALLEHMMKG